MRGVAVVLAGISFGVGVWALLSERYAVAVVAGVIELGLWAAARRSHPAGANPHSMPRDGHFDR